MRCKLCGFRVKKGKKHLEGYHHKSLFRRFGVIPADPETKETYPRVQMRL